MSDQNAKEFDELSSYVCFFATRVWKIPENAEHHPVHFLKTAKATKSQLLAGLRQATNDTIEATQDFTPTQVASFDAECRDQNVLSLSEVRQRYWSKYKLIVKKKRISNQTEYYLVAGLLSDMASPVSDGDRQRLQELADAYEQKIAQPGVQADRP